MSVETLAHWEVVRAKNAGQKPNPHGGQFDKWYISLHNLDGGEDCDDAYWQRKSPSEVTVGDKVYGKVKPGDYGDRFYLEKEDGYEASTGTSAPSQNVSKGDVDWDCRNAEIRRQHSQEMALRFFNIEGERFTYEEMQLESHDLLNGAIKTIIDWFDQDAIEAGQKASQRADVGAGGSGSPTLPSAHSQATPPADSLPVDLSGARTTEPSQEDTINRDHVLQLLDSAGLTTAAAREKVADYITGPLLVAGREKRALSGLQDFDRQATVLAQLKGETEGWIKGPLPTSDGFDDGELPPF